MKFITELFQLPALTAIFGFLSGLVSQFLLRKQISKHEIRKEKIAYKKAELENLKQCAEKLITEINVYDEFANHIVTTLTNGLHDFKKMTELSEKIKRIKDEISPKLQIHFHDLASFQNKYSEAVVAFHNSFFQGIKYEGLKQRGWQKKDVTRMNRELKELNKQKFQLIAETIKYLQRKEESLYDD